MKAQVVNSQALIALEQQGADKSSGDDFCIRSAATFFGIMTNSFKQIISETINRYNFIGEPKEVKFCGANTKLLT